MLEILLTSENTVRSRSNLDNNIQSKFLLSAIREAQDCGLQSIIGTALLDKLKALVASGEISLEDNAHYKAALDYCQTYLVYQSVVNVCLIATVKISNGGAQLTSDENLQPLGLDDLFKLQDQYQNKADFYAKRLQAFLYENKADYPELTENKCRQMRSNLYSAGTTSIWLGGRRGSPRGGYNRKRFL